MAIQYIYIRPLERKYKRKRETIIQQSYRIYYHILSFTANGQTGDFFLTVLSWEGCKKKKKKKERKEKKKEKKCVPTMALQNKRAQNNRRNNPIARK